MINENESVVSGDSSENVLVSDKILSLN